MIYQSSFFYFMILNNLFQNLNKIREFHIYSVSTNLDKASAEDFIDRIQHKFTRD